MLKPEDALSAKLNQLSPAQRDALLKKLREQKAGQPAPARHFRDLPIPPVARNLRDYPLSFAQERLWFLEQLEEGSAAYNVAAALELQGSLEPHLLQQTFQRIIQRHESLRTSFHATPDGARQRVADRVEWELPVTDLANAPAETIAKAIHAEANGSFRLDTAPLLRAKLFRTGADKFVLTIVMHHIISDAWSAKILLAEVSRTYSALAQKLALALPVQKVQYLDYAKWQRDLLAEGEAQRQLHYWKGKLDGYANLNLPTDRPRPALFTQRGAFHRITLPHAATRPLQQLCQESGTTLFNGLFATFQTMLYRYTQQTGFCIGTPVAGRIHQEIEPLIGFFVNTLPLCCDIQKGDDFPTLLRRVRKSTLEAQAHQDIPFEQLVDALQVERDGSYTPVFQVFFSYNPGVAEEQLSLPGIKARFLPADTDTAKFEISLVISDQPEGLSCHFEYNTDLFQADTIAMMATHFATLVSTLPKSGGTPLHTVQMLDQAEYESLSNQCYLANFPNEDIATLFEQQARRTPRKIALRQGSRSLTFGELDKECNRLAHHLIRQGVKQGSFVGLCFSPSIELVVAMLAALKAGATYVPMDPSYPAERLEYMAATASIRLLLTSSRTEFAPLQHCQTLAIDRIDLSAEPGSKPRRATRPDDLLYVIFTSGSTGVPKAATVTHRGEANLLYWYTHHYRMVADDRMLVFSAIGFDLTQKNLFAPLVQGAELHFADSNCYDPQQLVNTIREQGISWINCAPSAFYPLVDHCRDFSELASLRQLFFGGENIQLDNFRPWVASQHFHTRITNMYGPTECTDIAASYTLHDPASHRGPIPIGTPCANTSLYVLDEQLQFLPRGAVGELYIGGVGVGKGYLNNPELTAEKFLPSPFHPGEILYRTGDLVRYCHSNYLEFVARADDQIKIRGFRIEPGEIESRLRELEGVADAVVTARGLRGQQQLLAFLCLEEAIADGKRLPAGPLQRRLKQHLPDYMVPSAFVAIEKIPLTPNGKVDRKRLPEVDLAELQQNEYVAPRNPTEATLATIWQELLGSSPVSVTANFFELGGHSLLATRMLTRIRDAFGIELPLRTIFEVNTIEGLCEIIRAMEAPDGTLSNENEEGFEEGTL